MAKHKSSRRRRKNAFFSRRRGSNPSHHRRHRRRAHNPLPLPFNEIPVAVGGAIAGGVASSWVPNAVLGASDKGWLGYLANGLVAVGGALALQRWRSLALGWFIGGLTMTGGRIFDDLFGKQVVTFTSPLGSYYRPSAWALPSATGTDLTNAHAALALPPVAAGSPALAKAKLAGMGWNPRFTSRLAA
jgi:hypothetical protein